MPDKGGSTELMNPASIAASGNRPAKRCKQKATAKTKGPNSSPLTSLPLEILAEVLSYTRPDEILALARTNKYFCDTLVANPVTTFIWKKARARFAPQPIPDPTPNFTESSYAAYLFDRGVCEICKKRTRGMYASFSLRLRLCGSNDCQSTWKSTKGMNISPAADSLVPGLERNNPSVSLYISPNTSFVRAEDMNKVDDLRRKMHASLKTAQWFEDVEKPRLRRQAQKVNELSANLIHWKTLFEREANAIKVKNQQLARDIAQSQAWKAEHLDYCPTFDQLRRVKNSDLEAMALEEFERISDQVKAEMARHQEVIQRRKDARTFDQARRALDKVYDDLKTSGTGQGIMPHQQEFHKLPVIRRVQECASSPNDVVKDIKQSKLFKEMARVSMEHWREDARTSLRRVLGDSKWKKAEPPLVDPLDRLTARLRCQDCDTKGVSWKEEGGMSLAEACEHRCKFINPKKRSKYVWNAKRFVPDQKAIDAIRQVLMWAGYTEDDIISLEAPDEVGSRILCLSCPSPLVMDYKILLRHCQRHDSMQLKILPLQEASTILDHPIEHGLVAQLRKRTDEARSTRGDRIYGCRHCSAANIVLQEVTLEAASVPPEDGPEGSPAGASADAAGQVVKGARGSQSRAGQPTEKKKSHPKLFSFDGFRSHAKEKHGILWIGDEDIFRQLPDDQDASAG